LVLHGMNLVPKRKPDLPSQHGFGEDDAAMLAREGFNTVRLGIEYADIEPEPGRYDDAHIRAYKQELKMLVRHGLLPLADLHQDLFADRYTGNGMPDWMAVDDGAPNLDLGFPGSYFGNPALNRAFDNFWDNVDAPSGRPLQTHYAEGLGRLAEHLRDVDGLLGYDIMNEPWAGSRAATCLNPTQQGCPPVIGFEQTLLTDFTRRSIRGIRVSDQRHLVFYEPNLNFDFGAKTGLGDPQDAKAGFSFHNYCLAWLAGRDDDSGCSVQEQHVFDNAETHTGQTRSALLMTEFGSTNNPRALQRMAEAADRNRVGWQYWAYSSIGSSNHGGGSVIKDLSKPPTKDNLEQDMLDALVRPYPRVVAGTPREWAFDRDARRFVLSYDTAGVTGRAFAAPGSEGYTEVFVPRRHYGDGFHVNLKGAEVVAIGQDGQSLLLRNCASADLVSVEITPDSGKASPGQSAPGTCPAQAAAAGRAGTPGVDADRSPRGARRHLPATGTPEALQTASLTLLVAALLITAARRASRETPVARPGSEVTST
jgi:endoglycosylceramidase